MEMGNWTQSQNKGQIRCTLLVRVFIHNGEKKERDNRKPRPANRVTMPVGRQGVWGTIYVLTQGSTEQA
jgi:hypothetical protein